MELKLKFDDKLIALGGHLFGMHIWETQVKQHKDEQNITLVFPKQISCVTTSFGRGLLDAEIKKLGLYTVKRKYKIQSSREGFEKQFWDCWD